MASKDNTKLQITITQGKCHKKKELIRYYGGFRKEDIKLRNGLKKGFVVMVAFKINAER